MSLKQACLIGAVAAFGALAVPAAHAFTMENGQAPANGGAGITAAPNFDIGEQAKQFSKSGTDATAPGKSQFETPLGKGTLQFGVRQYNSNSPFAPTFGTTTGPTQRDFNRLTAPPGLQHLYDQ